MENQRVNRLPILDSEQRLKFVVHKSVIDRYLIAKRREISRLAAQKYRSVNTGVQEVSEVGATWVR